MAESTYREQLLLNSESTRDAMEALLRDIPILDEKSYIRFLNEVAICSAVGKIPPESADAVTQIATNIYQALSQAATMEVIRSQTKDPKASSVVRPRTRRHSLPQAGGVSSTQPHTT